MEKEENDVIGQVSEETLEKMRDFDEEEAYSLLCEIFADAQATGDYVKFQYDLNEWKKRYDLKYFSDAFRLKIKYMLSREFIDKVLKDYFVFEELSKKNPADGYAKLKKILEKAEKHKDKSKLNKDLEELYKEFPKSYLKQHYPHRIDILLSKSNLTKILEKFDSSLAYDDLNEIIEHHNDYSNAEEFKEAITEWQKLYPINDFNDTYKSQVEETLKTALDEQNLNQLFIVPEELDLNGGQVIQLDNINEYAWYDFCQATDGNIHNVDGIFNWLHNYELYINRLDDSYKTKIFDKLNYGFGNKLPPQMGKYSIPKMNSDDLSSLSDYNSFNSIKEAAVLQFIGILSNKEQLTHDDIVNLNVIDINSQIAKMIKDSNMNTQVIEGDTVTISNSQGDETSFKDTLKVTDDVLERISSSNNTSSDTATSATSSGGGVGVSISRNIPLDDKYTTEPIEDEKKTSDLKQENILPISIDLEKETPSEAVVIDIRPDIKSLSDNSKIEEDITTPDISENNSDTQINMPISDSNSTEKKQDTVEVDVVPEENHDTIEVEVVPEENQDTIKVDVVPEENQDTIEVDVVPEENQDTIEVDVIPEENQDTIEVKVVPEENQDTIKVDDVPEENQDTSSEDHFTEQDSKDISNENTIDEDGHPIEEKTRKSMFKRLFELLGREDKEDDEKEIDRNDE